MSENKKTTLTRRQSLMGIAAGLGAGLLAACDKSGKSNSQPAFVPNSQESASQTAQAAAAATKKQPHFLIGTTVALYGVCNGDVDIISADFGPKWDEKTETANPREMSPNRNITLIARGLPAGADYGGHYHIEDEIIHCPKGQLKIIIRENSGEEVVNGAGNKVVEKRHADAGNRTFK